MNDRYVHLTPRLRCALSMLNGSGIVADIGCDHGRLTAALLQQHACEQVIAADISEPSLEKAKQLLFHIGLNDRVSFRLGNGLDVLDRSENVDAIALLGMGGTLMVELLSRDTEKIKDHTALVLQPMRAQSDIREYLYRNAFRITHDRIVCERGRYYQIFRAEKGDGIQLWPYGFPNDFFEVGYQSFADADENLSPYCELQLSILNKQLRTAGGSPGESKLRMRIDAYRQIIEHLRNTYEHSDIL